MQQPSEYSRSPRWNWGLSWVVLAGGLMLASLATLYIKSNVERSAKRVFEFYCDEICHLISGRLDDHARILMSGAAFFNASEEVTREEWRLFNQGQKFAKQLPGIQGIGFSLLIPRSELPRHIQAIRNEGFPEYKLWPDGEREIYSSIIYLEPFSGRNQRAFGYDMFSEPVRRQAMELARDTDSAALSGKIILVQETNQDVQYGTLMYVPVYRKGMPVNTVEQRRAAIYGWVYSPYRMNDLMNGILIRHNLEQQQLQLMVFDDGEISPKALLYESYRAKRTQRWTAARFTRIIPVAFNGHYWTLHFTQTGGGFLTVEYFKVWITMLGGILVALLLFTLIRVLLNTRAAAQRMAKTMTLDLRKSEEALQKATDRLSLAVRAGGVGIWDYDVVNNLLVWDESMFRLYGITRDQFGGAYEAWQAGVHPEDRSRGNHEIQLALRGEKEFDTEFRVLWNDGSTHNIRAIARVQRDALDQPLRMIGTNWDITELKLAEKKLLESESNFRTFFESMTDMIIVGTPEGRIIFTNAAVTRTLGYSAAKLASMQVLDLHPAEKRQEAEEIFAAMFRGERESCPLPLACENGTLVPVETRIWFGKWNGSDCLFGICKNLSSEQEAQQRFERLFRNNPALMALSSLPERKFFDVNAAFLKVLGFARDDVIGKTTDELKLFPRPDQQAAVANNLLVDGRITDFELQCRRKDGTIIDGIFSGEVISNQGRQYFLTVMIDITARKRTEAELARVSAIQRELMHLATNFVNVPMERQDAAIEQSLATMGQMLHADRAYLFAYDFAKGIMSNTHEWCGAGTRPEIGNLQAILTDMFPEWAEAHRRGELVHVPSVAALPIDSSLRQVLDPQGIRSLITLPLMQGADCLGFVGFDAVQTERIWRDEEVALLRVLAELYAHFEARRATEREMLELQKRLTQARDVAQAAALAKSLFLANMSHEIRTPLNAILGYAQIMERDCRICPTGLRLNAITRSGEHLLALITDLLELVRSDASVIPLVPGNFDFYQMLEDVRLMFVRQPDVQGLNLEVAYTPEVPHFIYADQGKVRQVLINLLGNAIKFTEKGAVRLSASVLADGRTEGITIAVDVEDTGCGIREDEQERIFDIFGQAEQGRKSGKGTGLGLPLSRRYARALGGDVTVSSRPGAGSIFRFVFHALAASSSETGLPLCGNVLRLAGDQIACRMLVVDDDQASREMLADMLTSVGFKVEMAASAAQALQRLRQADGIDLVLMDKSMPEMDGYEAIGRIRNLPEGRKLKVLAVTAAGFSDERAQALAAGADGYISKPVRREQLLEEIGRIAAVRYEYEQPQLATLTATHVAGLYPEKLKQLPVAQRQSMDQALRLGDIQQLRKLVETIALEHAGIAAGIGVLVDAYDYDRLQRLLDSAKETTT